MSNEAEFKELSKALERAQDVVDVATNHLFAVVDDFNKDTPFGVTATVRAVDGRVKLDVLLNFKPQPE